jgi:hypothetical protein
MAAPSISTTVRCLATSKTGDTRPFHVGTATFIELEGCNTGASRPSSIGIGERAAER